jgi:hypothetical protein
MKVFDYSSREWGGGGGPAISNTFWSMLHIRASSNLVPIEPEISKTKDNQKRFTKYSRNPRRGLFYFLNFLTLEHLRLLGL